MYPGETRLVTCDGTGFYTIVLTGYYRTFTATGTWVKAAGYTAHSGCQMPAGGGGGGASTILCQRRRRGACSPLQSILSPKRNGIGGDWWGAVRTQML